MHLQALTYTVSVLKLRDQPLQESVRHRKSILSFH